MQDLKISLVTVVYNAEATIRRCIESVISQKFGRLEYIIIDGGSTDKTLSIIEQYKDNISIFLSGPDNGIYDAMNKGIKLATGDIVGMLNADDFFADEFVLNEISKIFGEKNAQIIYGDLEYINAADAVTRRWRSGNYTTGSFNLGWMPPHPTFYCRRELYLKLGLYSTNYGTAADYELMLRFMFAAKIRAFYIRKVLVKMKTGGVSNKSLKNRVESLSFDLKAMRNNKIWVPLLTVVFKPVRKVFQYL